MRPVLTNPASWTAVLVPVLMIVTLSENVIGFVSPSSWEAVLASSGTGLILASPILCAGAAWTTGPIERWRRQNALVSTRPFLARCLRYCGPLITAALVGYIACVALVANASGPVWGGWSQFAVALSIGAMALTALIVGCVLGRALHTAVAVPTALILQYAVVALPLLNPLNEVRNAFGYGLPSTIQSINYSIDTAAIYSPIVLLAGVAIAILLADSPRVRFTRISQFAVGVVAFVFIAAILAGVPVPAAMARPAEERTCVGSSPQLCLWPELSGEAETLHSMATSFSVELDEHGLDRPAKVVSSSGEGTKLNEIPWNLSPRDSYSGQVLSFASGFQSAVTCPDVPQAPEQLAAQETAMLALAIALGADPQSIASGVSSSLSPDVLGTDPDILGQLGMRSGKDGFAIYKDWSGANAQICP